MKNVLIRALKIAGIPAKKPGEIQIMDIKAQKLEASKANLISQRTISYRLNNYDLDQVKHWRHVNNKSELALGRRLPFYILDSGGQPDWWSPTSTAAPATTSSSATAAPSAVPLPLPPAIRSLTNSPCASANQISAKLAVDTTIASSARSSS